MPLDQGEDAANVENEAVSLAGLAIPLGSRQ